MDDSFVYVSNYFKTAKYSFDQIEHIAEASLLGSKTVKFKLVGKGVFGINILFLPDKVRYDYFFKNHPILRTLYSVAWNTFVFQFVIEIIYIYLMKV